MRKGNEGLAKKMFENLMPKSKKGAGVIGGIVSGVAGLVILIVIVLVIVSTLLSSNLLSTADQQTAGNLSANLSAGINKVALQVPTIFNIAVIVLLIGLLVFLWAKARPVVGAGGGSL